MRLFIACLAIVFGHADAKKEISFDQLLYWDLTANGLSAQYSLSDGNVHRMYAYLYQAQKAYSDASNGKGDIGPVSAYVLKLFFPKFRNLNTFDSDSIAISTQIENDIMARFREETKQIHPMKIDLFKDSWVGKKPYFGIYAPSMKPWFLKSADEFRADAPPSPEDTAFWDDQLSQVKQKMGEATDEQKYLILYWDSKADWKRLADEYMAKENIPIPKRIEVRAKLAAALCDVYIALWDAKYTYLVRRPYQLDPKLNIAVADPNHPSYPCAHCGIGTTAVTVMSYYFPEIQEEWQKQLEACDLSRIQAGLHFPVDVEGATKQGLEVGKAVLERSTQF